MNEKRVARLLPMAALLSTPAVTAVVAATSVSAQDQPNSPAPAESEGATTDDLIKAILIKEAAKTIAANIEASKRESGEIDKLIRAIAGISIADMKRYGICGGPNSEVRKLGGDLCN